MTTSILQKDVDAIRLVDTLAAVADKLPSLLRQKAALQSTGMPYADDPRIEYDEDGSLVEVWLAGDPVESKPIG